MLQGSETVIDKPGNTDILSLTKAMRVRMLHCELEWEMSDYISMGWNADTGVPMAEKLGELGIMRT